MKGVGEPSSGLAQTVLARQEHPGRGGEVECYWIMDEEDGKARWHRWTVSLWFR